MEISAGRNWGMRIQFAKVPNALINGSRPRREGRPWDGEAKWWPVANDYKSKSSNDGLQFIPAR
jgi:hypothetical protein